MWDAFVLCAVILGVCFVCVVNVFHVFAFALVGKLVLGIWFFLCHSLRLCSRMVRIIRFVWVFSSCALKSFTACWTVGSVRSAQHSRLPAVCWSFYSSGLGNNSCRSDAKILS